MDIFTVLFYQPLFNLLVVLYRLLGDNLGLAIIAIALISRIITIPVTMRQIKMAEQGKELNAKMKEVREKYKNDKEKQSQELMKIQSEYLPGQLAGCLPLILQLILIINIYNVISALVVKGATSFAEVAYGFVPTFAEGYKVNSDFFGINLQQVPGQLSEPSIGVIIPFIVLSILVGVTQYLSTKILMGMNEKRQAAADKGKEAEAKKSTKSKKAKGGKNEAEPDFAEIMQQSTKQTMILLPILLVFMSWNFPAGLSLYWTVQSGFVIIQQIVVDKLREFKLNKS